MGEQFIITLSAVSKRTHEKKINVQVVLQVPAGMTAEGGSGWSIGPQVTFDQLLDPGGKVEAWLRVRPVEASVFTIKGNVNYTLGDQAVERDVSMPIVVGE